MVSKFLNWSVKDSPLFARFLLTGIVFLSVSHTVGAETIELSITGYWTENDFKVTARQDTSYNPTDPKFDGAIFGVTPSAGNVTLNLIVKTDGSVFFPKGTQYGDAKIR